MRRIGVVTFARSEYSSCLPVLRAIQADPELELHLIVAGMHLSPEYGLTVEEIEAAGFPIADRLETLLSSSTPGGMAQSVGLTVSALAQSFARLRPDLLFVVGDRLELLAVGTAALPFRIPMAHASGGDVTEGALDNQVRHAVSKMSHLHFPAMQEHADRLLQMGEEPWRVHVTGDPALDLLQEVKLLGRDELATALAIELRTPLISVSHHPTTLGTAAAADEVRELTAALAQVDGTLVITYPNADAESRPIIEELRRFTNSRPDAHLFSSLGPLRYYSLLAQADLIVGNSSSGIWEAPSFALPAVNVGDRQRGRLRAGNVVDVPPHADRIYAGIRQALEPAFRQRLRGLDNPYGDGRAAARIVEALKTVTIDAALLQKRFCDLPLEGKFSG